MSKQLKSNMFMYLSILYFTVVSFVFYLNIGRGDFWFSQWFHYRFFTVQLVAFFVIGLVIENKKFSYMYYARFKSRKKILKEEILNNYNQGIIYLNIMFIFVIAGALWIGSFDHISDVLQLIEWYIRYMFGFLIFIHITMVFKWSNNSVLSRYSAFITFLAMVFEVVFLNPYLQVFFSWDINILFSWVFQKGWISFVVMLCWIVVAFVLNYKLCNRKDLI